MAWPFKPRTRGADGLTASVMQVPMERGRLAQRRSLDAEWQRDAWLFYHLLGEVRFCARYMGNTLARVRFFVGTRDHPGDPVIPIPDDAKGDDLKVRDVLSRIKGRDGTFSSLARIYGIHRFVAGESYLVGEEGLEGETWEFLSTTELRRVQRNQATQAPDGPSYERNDGNDNYVAIGEESLVLRFWCRDPEFRNRADSPLRRVLDFCGALRAALMMQTAGDKSRLATAGLLLIPAEAELPKAPITDNPGHPAQQPRLMLMDSLLQSMEIAMESPGSVAAISPIMAEVKAEFIDKFTRLTFDREVDKTIVARIDHLIRRFAQGVDLPPEILLGLGDANHWSGWLVSEQTVSAHVSPMAAEFCEDLDVGFLKPTLEALSVKDPDKYAVGFDVTDLITSPDRAQHAITLYNLYELGGDELLEALGFDPAMRPDIDEIIHRIMIARAANPRNPDPGPDLAALQGKAPPPTGAEKPVPGKPDAALNPEEPEPDASKSGQEGTPQEQTQPTAGKGTATKNGKATPAAKGKQSGPTKAGGGNAKTPKAGQKPPADKTAKTAAIGRMVAAIDTAIDQALQLDDRQFTATTTRAIYWGPLHARIASEVADLDVAERVIDGVMLLARSARTNPGLNVWDAATVLCDAALFDPDDLLEEDEVPV